MSEAWLSIIGLGEDGPVGLAPATLSVLEKADIVFGPQRHLELVGKVPGEKRQWPVPFADGLPMLRKMRGQKVAVLVSGDPFWFGAGTVLAKEFDATEWQAFPGPSVFSLAAARLGWPLEHTLTLGLHAAPFAKLRPMLSPNQRAIVTLRDGVAAEEFLSWLVEQGFGQSKCHVLEALGGPKERMRSVTASAGIDAVLHPVVVAIDVAGDGKVLPCAAGKPDDAFQHDGQITKRPVRAMTVSALAPKPGELLWDLGAGSGSIAIEWALCHPSCRAIAVDCKPGRVANIDANVAAFGLETVESLEGKILDLLPGLAAPDAVFVGGGLTREVLNWLSEHLSAGTRLVANAVTLDTEALLIEAQARLGGTLLKVELAEAEPLGRFRGWKSSYPIVQWSVVL